MQITRQEAEHLYQSGVEALRQGRAGDARARFEQLVAAGATGEMPWLLLAIARRGDKDVAGEEQALNHLLAVEPRSIRGHILKGDCRANAGDDGAAIQFYKSALGLAESVTLPPDVMDDVRGAEQSLADLQKQAHASREARLSERGLPADQWSPRFRHALELAAGQRRQYLQQPTAFAYPELPQTQYYDPARFDWSAELEAAAPVIREELRTLLESQGTEDFRAYIQTGSDELRMDQTRGLSGNKDWSALFLCENGSTVTKAIERCPKTWEAVQKAPLPTISGWGPTVMFSLLTSGARIAAHTGMFNTRLICHLPLIVPPNCRFRVGNEVREWEEGKLLIFDDTIEHEAWNDSGEDRVILIFDIWRPELSERERGELSALFAS